jgi:hypothetical protein
MAIDDKFDQISQQYPEESPNRVLDLTLKALSLIPGVGVPITLADAIRSHFSSQKALERLKVFSEAVIEEVRKHDRELSEIKAKIGTADFAQVFLASANIVVFTPNVTRIRQFGWILGYEATSEDEEGWDEAASLVDDLSRLTEKDLDALRIMIRFQGEHVRDVPTPQEHDALENAFKNVIRAAVDSGMSNYEFYGRALRLSGFGLARPITGKLTLWAPQDMVFGPTPRGKRLVEIISQV